MNEKAVNQATAEQICRTYQWRDQQLHDGECVALLDGEVVAVAPDLDQAIQALRAIDPNRDRGMIVEVGPLVPDVIR